MNYFANLGKCAAQLKVIKKSIAKLKPIARVLAWLVQTGCVTHCVLEYIGDFALCNGPSMEPTLSSNNLILSEHITPYWFQNYKRGDIVIARSPTNPTQFICKRITGLPGDRVNDGYFADIVPVGHVWLEGDNTDNSKDSREYGPVPQGLILGKAVCRIWPIRQFKSLINSRKETNELPCR